mgnify:CR=1 FL=1
MTLFRHLFLGNLQAVKQLRFLVNRSLGCVEVLRTLIHIICGEFRAFTGGYQHYRRQAEKLAAGQWAAYESEQRRLAAWERAARQRESVVARLDRVRLRDDSRRPRRPEIGRAHV